MQKLDVHDVAGLVRYAIKGGADASIIDADPKKSPASAGLSLVPAA
jgi:hypothetical protein